MLIPDNISKFDSNGEKLLYLRFKNDGAVISNFACTIFGKIECTEIGNMQCT